MSKTIFTYGAEGQPFYGGWTEIDIEDDVPREDDLDIVIPVFRTFHPDKLKGVLNCASYYSENEFFRTEMATYGNFGYGCHERIVVKRETFKNEEAKCTNLP